MSKILDLTLAGLLTFGVPGCATKEIKTPPAKSRSSTLTLLGFGKCVDLIDYLKRQGIKDLDIPYNPEVESRINRVTNIGDILVITGISIEGAPPDQKLTEVCFRPEYKGDLGRIIDYIRTGNELYLPKQ